MNQFLEQLDHVRAIGIGIILVGIYWMVGYDDGTSLQTQIANLNNDLQKNEQEIKKVEQSIEAVKRFTLKMNALGDRFDKLVRYIPEEFTPSDQMKIISNEAKAAGTNILKIKSGGKGAKFQFYEELSVDVELQGSYTQIILFLSNLTKIDKVLVLKSMKMKTASGAVSAQGENISSVVFSGTFSGYKYITDSKANDKEKK